MHIFRANLSVPLPIQKGLQRLERRKPQSSESRQKLCTRQHNNEERRGYRRISLSLSLSLSLFSPFLTVAVFKQTELDKHDRGRKKRHFSIHLHHENMLTRRLETGVKGVIGNRCCMHLD
jgi:hypothetical protein